MFEKPMFKKLFVASVVLGIGAMSATGCSSGSDPTAKCKEVVSANCDKLFTCFTGPTLDAIKSVYGSTADECKTKLGQQICMSGQNQNQNPCPNGTSFDSAKADSCISDYKALSCSDLMSGKAPQSCMGGFCK